MNDNRRKQPEKSAGWTSLLRAPMALALAGLGIVFFIFLGVKALADKEPADTEPVVPVASTDGIPTTSGTPDTLPPDTTAPDTVPSETPETEEVTTEAPTTEPPTTEASVDSQKQPSADLPFVDTLGEVKPTDFAWIADVHGGMQGSFLSNEELLGKWKGEMIFNGTWELIYLTIDTDGMVYVESVKYNDGDGWIDSEEDGKYFNYDCEFDINRVYGLGELGKIDLYEFISSNGVQYGIGTIDVSTIHVDVYLVRP